MHRSTAAAATTRLLLAALIAGSALAAGCTTNIATGNRQLDYLSREDEIAIGEESQPQLTQEYGGAITDPAINSYITRVAMSMVEHTEGDYRELPWQFTLLNSDVINAFALPGGKVFISRALAEEFTTEAQLAGVLGHEIGHVTAEHADRSIQNQLPASVLATIGGAVAGESASMQAAVNVLVSGAGTFALRYSREQENEADQLGMRYMTKAGYHPKGMLEVMQVLARATEGAGGPPEWLSTHPAPQTRIGIIRERLDSERYRKQIAAGNLVENEARFQSEFLARLRAVPAPARTERSSRFDLSDPAGWCWHCARRDALVAAFSSAPVGPDPTLSR
ncbi:MAG: M48 family metallopeptidase [Planctomycetota bacterium]|nr:M48 family metallopeptidase [Planctomycetota bacterium]